MLLHICSAKATNNLFFLFSSELSVSQSSFNVKPRQQPMSVTCISLKPQHIRCMVNPFIPMQPPLHPAPHQIYNQPQNFFPSSPHHQIAAGGFYLVNPTTTYMHPQHHHQRSNVYHGQPNYVEQQQCSTKRLSNDYVKGRAEGNEVINNCNKFLENVEHGFKAEKVKLCRNN
jgi:hypothetical protein